jgi:hypothetical protein
MVIFLVFLRDGARLFCKIIFLSKLSGKLGPLHIFKLDFKYLIYIRNFKEFKLDFKRSSIEAEKETQLKQNQLQVLF